MFNEKAKKVYVNYYNKLEERLKKYGMKQLGAYAANIEHLAIMIFEAPSLEVFQKASMEPEVMALSAYASNEIIIGQRMEDAMKMVKGK
jgi:hypothetical protein